MTLETILNEYKKNLESNLKQIELNDKIDNLLLSLENQDNFNKINIVELETMLNTANYDSLTIKKILMTIKYIQLNNSLTKEYEKALKEAFRELLELKHEVISKSECEELLIKIAKLQETITSKDLFISDFDLLFKVFAELKIPMNSIAQFVKEIDKHNQQVILNQKVLEEDIEKLGNNQKLTIKEEDSKTNSNLQAFITKNHSLFSEFEQELLTNEYATHKEQMEEKFAYLNQAVEFKFIKDNLEMYKKLFIILLVFSNLNIIQEIIDLSKKYSIEIASLLPVFFISSNKDNDFSIYKDEFYHNLAGSFETLKEVILMFSSNIEPKILVTEYSTLCMTRKEKIQENINVLNLYGIPLSKNSIKCLTINNLSAKIDNFIEAGLYEYIKSVPAILLNEDEAFFYRIYYANKNGIQIKKRFLFKEITDVDGLDINRDNYLEKVKVYKPSCISSNLLNDSKTFKSLKGDIKNNLLIQLLVDYEINDFVYKISDLYFSKNKVLSIYENYLNSLKIKNIDLLTSIKGIIIAFISDTILDYEDTKKVVMELLKNYIKCYDLNQEQIESLCTDFDILKEDMDSLFKQTRNGVN